MVVKQTTPGPLHSTVALVDPKTGKPTAEFIRKWQTLIANGGDLTGIIALINALQADVVALQAEVDGVEIDVTALQAAIAALLATEIIAGTGLTGGGPLSADVTLQLSALTISQLIPAGGNAGEVLTKNGPSNFDVAWAPGGGGGGGASVGEIAWRIWVGP